MNEQIKAFLAEVEDEAKREDCESLVTIMEQESGYKAALDGKIIGFGRYRYKYASGREGESIVTGFSPRARNITLYVMPGFSGYQDLLQTLGKHRAAKSCLYINRLSDVDEEVLRKIIKHSVEVMRDRYECRES